MNYLRDFYREAGTSGLLDIAENLRAREHSGDPHAAAQLDALANGLLTLSNENVGDGQTTGGYDLLPDDLKDILSRINDASADRGLMGSFYDDVYTERQAPAVADLLAEANPGFIPGTEFASELDHAASRLVDIATASHGLYPEKYDPIAEKFLEIGTRNESASYELLTSPDAARTLMPLLEHEWRDDGATVGRLVDWIADDGRSSLGEVNPALTQSIAASLSPYVVDMVTSDRTLSTTSSFGQLGPVETTRLFSVLDSDPRAGAVISGHALAAADEIDHAFARSDREPPPIMLGETSGRLRAAVEGGLDIEIGDRVNDIDERKAERATTRAGFFGAAQAIGAGALSYLPPPWGVAASTGTYAVGAFLASDIIDADGNLADAYTQSPQARFRLGAGDPDTPDQTQVTDNEISYSMFAELVETGRIPVTSVSEYVRNDGGVITYAELIERESTGDFDSSRDPARGRQTLIESLPEYLNDAGLRSAEGYLHQHSIAVGAYHNMIFGRVNGDGTFDAAIRGSGSPTAMSRWPV